MQANILTPIGELIIVEELDYIISLKWADRRSHHLNKISSPLLYEAETQLSAYFSGQLRSFDLPLNPKGTLFQKNVYKLIQKIPLGMTKTYGALASKLNTASRPVGGACASNPLPIIIPCHRVIGKAGLGGYSGRGGIKTKSTLLTFEAQYEHTQKDKTPIFTKD